MYSKAICLMRLVVPVDHSICNERRGLSARQQTDTVQLSPAIKIEEREREREREREGG
eukprot:SAG31_NODE_4444_length_3225_cov_2.086052_8_plen_57_part_01